MLRSIRVFSGVYVSKDGSRAVAVVSYARDRTPVESRYYFQAGITREAPTVM